MKKLTKSDIENEWRALPKNWYAIYQWKRATAVAYTEWIAALITSSHPMIELVADGLRKRPFRLDNHRGQIKLNTPIAQVTEKRLVRAMFNGGQLPFMGRVIDYEIPLKETNEARHGDIDLLCLLPQTVLCVEAKEPKSGESLLKAVLEAFVYTSLISTRRASFLSDFGLGQNVPLTPAILTFAVAASGRQLEAMDQFPQLLGLIRILNRQLTDQRIEPLRFFVVRNSGEALQTCLTTTQETNGDVKVVFADGFSLSITEQIVR